MQHIRRAVTVDGRTVHACSDGTFAMPRGFLPDADGSARLPIGCLVIPGTPNILIDAGMGPVESKVLSGGALLDHLAAIGLAPEDIGMLAFTHLHLDHVGWVATEEGNPVFSNAQALVARADWDVVLQHPEDRPFTVAPHVETGLRAIAERGRLTLLDGEHELAPGVTAVPAPGHTPGHLVYVVEGEGDRLVWVGDAMYLPQQPNEGSVAMSDGDAETALQTRRALWQDLNDRGGVALGSHFPELRPGRVADGEWSPWT
jgi:glyoxylase-like metal-dependent hydrolase (beta-lactamase superfamily II)